MEDGRSYLIFKMRKNWKGLGRVVRRPTAGYYLAIVPCEWKRDEEMSGSAPIAPENVQISGYKAHFFALRQNENTSIAFIDANGGRIVIGEEGSGRNRWRTQFSPQESMIDQKMPDVEEKAKEETESATNKAEDDEAKRAVEERLRKEREESIIKEKERLEKIKAEEEKEREARLEKQHELERQLRKARRDVFSEDRVIAEQAEKDIKRLKEELWPYYEPQYNKAYGSMMNHLLSATE